MNIDCLSSSSIPENDHEPLIQDVKFFEEAVEIRLETVNFKTEEKLFEQLITTIQKANFNRWLYVSKVHLNENQWSQLSKLCNTNQLKGLQVYAVDYFQGVVPEYVHMNQTLYNEAKTFIAEHQVRWTLLQALERYFPKMSINSVFDFGAGYSPELLYLTKKLANLETIVAADFDKQQLEKLRNAFSPHYQEKLETFAGPFVNYDPKNKFDLFLSSFTFPYRAPEEFPAVWKKAVSMTQPGGVMAFHLFGKPVSPIKEMTYHTLKQIRHLLISICSEFEILVEYKDGSSLFVYWMDGVESHTNKEVLFKPKDFNKTDVYGGDTPEWGTLFHIVAKLKEK